MTQRLIDTTTTGHGSTRIETILTCLAKYALNNEADAYNGGSSPTPPTRDNTTTAQPLATGSLGHVALAHHYARQGARQPGGVIIDGVVEHDADSLLEPLDAIEEAWPKHPTANRDAVVDAYKHYRAHYANEDILRVVAVETTFTAQIECVPHTVSWFDREGVQHTKVVSAYTYSPRADLVTEGYDGKFRIWDHKWVGRIAQQARYYAASTQVNGFKWIGEQSYGDRWGGFVLNLVGHGQIGFARPPVPSAAWRVATFPTQVLDAEARLEAMRATGRAPSTWTRADSATVCQTQFGPCEHMERCHHGASL